MKVYAVEIIGQKEPTYISEAEVAKLVNALNLGAKLVMVGNTLINPSCISRIRRAWDSVEYVEQVDEELLALLEGKEIKKLK